MREIVAIRVLAVLGITASAVLIVGLLVLTERIDRDQRRREITGSVRSRAGTLIVVDKSPRDHAFCMIRRATWAPLAKRKRRRDAETVWL